MEILGAQGEEENPQVVEEEPVEDITTVMAPAISTTPLVDLNVTPIFFTMAKETFDDSHMAEVSPSSILLTFQVISRALPPLSSEGEVALSLGPYFSPFPQGSQLASQLVPDFSKKVDFT